MTFATRLNARARDRFTAYRGKAMSRIKDRDWSKVRHGARVRLADGWRLFLYAVGRFHRDRCQQVAQSLTYTTLLAMVPLMTIAFAILAAFPAFEGVREQAQAMLFSNMVPEVGDQVSGALAGFTKNMGSMTAIGIIFVAVTSIMTLNTIETVFNRIWRVGQPRPMVTRLLAFWAMLTLGPLLFGASVSLSTTLFAIQHTKDLVWWSKALLWLANVFPFMLSVAGFIALFQLVPNFPVARRNAIIGGIVTAVMFELLKRGFGFYIGRFGSYQVVYGALATIPIFMLWVYLCWMVVLLGAEITASLPEWRVGRGFGKSIATPGRRLGIALALLGAIHQRAREGKPFRDRHLLEKIPSGSDLLGEVLGRLLQDGFVARGERGQWLLGRDLETTTLHDLMESLGLTLGSADLRGESHMWQDRLDQLLSESDHTTRDRFSITLREMLAANAPPPHAERPATSGPAAGRPVAEVIEPRPRVEQA